VEGFCDPHVLGTAADEQTPLLEPDVVITNPERIYVELNDLFMPMKTIGHQKKQRSGRGSENHSQSWSSRE